MLVLKRKLFEEIVIRPADGGEEIIVTVTSIESNGVRLGVTAPRDVIVHRREVTDRVLGVHLGSPPEPELLPVATAPATQCPLCSTDTPGAIRTEHPDMGAIYATCPCRQTVHPEAVNYASVD